MASWIGACASAPGPAPERARGAATTAPASASASRGERADRARARPGAAPEGARRRLAAGGASTSEVPTAAVEPRPSGDEAADRDASHEQTAHEQTGHVQTGHEQVEHEQTEHEQTEHQQGAHAGTADDGGAAGAGGGAPRGEPAAQADREREAAAPEPLVVEPPHDPRAPVVLPTEVEEHIRELARSGPRRRPHVFAKVGDSATVNRAFLRCLSSDEELRLEDGELRPVIERIRASRVAGADSFSRQSEAAGVGWSAHRVLRGNPSPIASEVRELSPRVALIMFGGNDIELGRMSRYATKMSQLVDRLLGWGVVPVLSTIPARGDDPEADAEVPRYNAVVLALARDRRVPVIDLHRALDELPNRGLASDGVHPSAPVVDGRAQGCDFTDHGLRFGQNVRNLLTLRVLDRIHAVLSADERDGPRATWRRPPRRAPRRVVFGDTRDGGREVEAYPGCEADQPEAGPETRHPVRVDEPGEVRAWVMYGSDVDVDVHLVPRGEGGEACLARGDRSLEAVVEPGEYDVVVDTFGTDAENAGEYLLLIER